MKKKYKIFEISSDGNIHPVMTGSGRPLFSFDSEDDAMKHYQIYYLQDADIDAPIKSGKQITILPVWES